MVEVIPSINVPTFGEVQERIRKIEPYVKWCHLDITDGVFSRHPTWRNPADLAGLQTKLKVEAHLMVVEPEKIIERWFVKPVKRIIVHLEAVHPVRSQTPTASAVPLSAERTSNGARDIDSIIQKCREAGVEIGLAINPETSWNQLQPWCAKTDLFQILTVMPGPSGQKMDEGSFDKIAHLRRNCPGSKIEIDGGINPETAQRAKEAGADLLVAGAYVFNSPDIPKAIQELIA